MNGLWFAVSGFGEQTHHVRHALPTDRRPEKNCFEGNERMPRRISRSGSGLVGVTAAGITRRAGETRCGIGTCRRTGSVGSRFLLGLVRHEDGVDMGRRTVLARMSGRVQLPGRSNEECATNAESDGTPRTVVGVVSRANEAWRAPGSSLEASCAAFACSGSDERWMADAAAIRPRLFAAVRIAARNVSYTAR